MIKKLAIIAATLMLAACVPQTPAQPPVDITVKDSAKTEERSRIEERAIKRDTALLEYAERGFTMLGKEILDKQKQTPYGAFNAFLEAYKRRDFEAADSLLCKDLGTAFFNPDIDPESLSETDKTVIYLITENLTADVLKADYTGDMPLLTVHIKNNDVYNLVLETSNIIYGDTKLQELTESGGTEVANARLAELIAQTLDYLQNAKDLPVIDELIDVSVHLADGEYRVVMTPDLCSCLTGFYVDLLNDLNNITNEHQNQNK